jgi:hypothetical protein
MKSLVKQQSGKIFAAGKAAAFSYGFFYFYFYAGDIVI